MSSNLIKDFMSADILSVDSEKTIREAAEFMIQKGVRSLLVSEKGNYAGIVTKTTSYPGRHQ